MTGHLLKPLDCDISILSPGTFGALSDVDLIHYRMADTLVDAAFLSKTGEFQYVVA